MSHKTFPVAVHLFLRKDNQLLLLRRYNTGYEDGKYSVIAGHLDGGEDVYTAIIREAREEADIIIERNNLNIIQVMHRKKNDEERIDYFFECHVWRNNINNNEPEKCDELVWAEIDKLPGNTIDYIREAIQNHEKNIKFSVFGWQ